MSAYPAADAERIRQAKLNKELLGRGRTYNRPGQVGAEYGAFTPDQMASIATLRPPPPVTTPIGAPIAAQVAEAARRQDAAGGPATPAYSTPASGRMEPGAVADDEYRRHALAIESERKGIIDQLVYGVGGHRIEGADREALIARRHAIERNPEIAALNRVAGYQAPMTPQQSVASNESMRGQYERAVAGGYGSMPPAVAPKGPADFSTDRQSRTLGLDPTNIADRARMFELDRLRGGSLPPVGWVAGGLQSPPESPAPNPFGGKTPADYEATYGKRLASDQAMLETSRPLADKVVRGIKEQEAFGKTRGDQERQLALAQGEAQVAQARSAAASYSPENEASRADLERMKMAAMGTRAQTEGITAQTSLREAQRGAEVSAANDPESNVALGNIERISKNLEGSGYALDSPGDEQEVNQLESSVRLLEQRLAAAPPAQKSALRTAMAATLSGLRFTPGLVTRVFHSPLTDRYYAALARAHSLMTTAP